MKPRTHVALAALVAAPLAALVVAACTGGATLPAPTVAGTIAFAKMVDDGNADIYVVDSDGSGHPPPSSTPGWEEDPSWSPDGSKIAYAAYSPGDFYVGTASLWVMNADGTQRARLSEGNGFCPAWSPDGKHIVYAAIMGAEAPKIEIRIMNADGSGVRKLADTEGLPVTPSWTAKGEVLFLSNGDLYSINPDGSGRIQLTKGNIIGEYALSPDGKTLAYYARLPDICRSGGVKNRKHIVEVSLGGGGMPVSLLEPVGPVELLEPAEEFIKDDLLATLSWTRDGRALVVASGSLDGRCGSPLYIVNADGSGVSQVPGVDAAYDPAWRPE